MEGEVAQAGVFGVADAVFAAGTATVTLSFPGLTSGTAAALTMAMLRPELFRIVVEAPPPHIIPAFTDDFAGD